MSNRKHTPWTSALTLTGAAATVVPLTAMTPLTHLGKSTDRAKGEGSA